MLSKNLTDQHCHVEFIFKLFDKMVNKTQYVEADFKKVILRSKDNLNMKGPKDFKMDSKRIVTIQLEVVNI